MEKTKINRFKIAGGNSTSIVEGCEAPQRNKLSAQELNKVEQVGFFEENPKLPTLTMMGNELCINGTLALAKMLGQKTGELLTSGVSKPVRYSNIGDITTAIFTLEPKVLKKRRIVLFDGIGYICVEGASAPTRSTLADLANEFNLPAFGLASYQGNRLTPFVYVKETDSLVAETACGSGSVALFLIEGTQNVVQTTGQRISVLKNGDDFIVSAKVTRMK